MGDAIDRNTFSEIMPGLLKAFGGPHQRSDSDLETDLRAVARFMWTHGTSDAERKLEEIDETLQTLENGLHINASFAGRIEQLVGNATGRAERAETEIKAAHDAIDEQMVEKGPLLRERVATLAGLVRGTQQLLVASVKLAEQPIPIQLNCPRCHEQHIDEGEWAVKAHHTHACQHCGLTWRPAKVATVGVRFIPGFKNEVSNG